MEPGGGGEGQNEAKSNKYIYSKVLRIAGSIFRFCFHPQIKIVAHGGRTERWGRTISRNATRTSCSLKTDQFQPRLVRVRRQIQKKAYDHFHGKSNVEQILYKTFFDIDDGFQKS